MPKRKKKDPYAGFRREGGKFLPGHPGGPGRPPAPVELENLRAINRVWNAEEWANLARTLLKKAKKGNAEAFAWGERKCLGSASVLELRKADGLEPGENDDRKKDLLALNEEVLREELLRYLEKVRSGPLEPHETERVIEIRRLLTEAQSVEKLPDLSGLDPAAAEEELFKPKENT